MEGKLEQPPSLQVEGCFPWELGQWSGEHSGLVSLKQVKKMSREQVNHCLEEEENEKIQIKQVSIYLSKARSSGPNSHLIPYTWRQVNIARFWLVWQANDDEYWLAFRISLGNGLWTFRSHHFQKTTKRKGRGEWGKDLDNEPLDPNSFNFQLRHEKLDYFRSSKSLFFFSAHGAEGRGLNYEGTHYFNQHHCSARMSEISILLPSTSSI